MYIERTIDQVRNFETGEVILSSELLNYEREYEQKLIFNLRRKLEDIAKFQKRKYLCCAYCGEKVVVRGKYNNKYKKVTIFFKHYRNADKCPVDTINLYSQKEIDAMRYNGAKESYIHKFLKEFIASFLIKDKKMNNIKIEKVVKSTIEKKDWKKPDISAVFLNKKMVFEIQLQTTYLNIIQDREDFYKENKIYIMWFFYNFNVEKNTYSEKDIFYGNNLNAYVITNKSIALSLILNDFIFYCYYRKPFIQIDDEIDFLWSKKIIKLSNLNFDSKNYKVFFFNYIEEEKKLQTKIKIDKFMLDTEQYDYENINYKYYDFFSNLGIKKFETSLEILKIINIINSLKKNKVIAFIRFHTIEDLILYAKKEHKIFLFFISKAMKVFPLKNRKIKFEYKIYLKNMVFFDLFYILFPELKKVTRIQYLYYKFLSIKNS